ncbi:MAG: hypothetical protein IEMM0002_1181 [bacterium]|nr:MAG: hypothetical protein IEMM0002_1181 [bacterium]
MSKPKLALILGSGFSKVAGLPTTADIPSKFLETPDNSNLPLKIDEQINDILRNFWKRIFGYSESNDFPSLENHFTLLDLAANSGHHLGRYYSPKRLRAIRRMSIHRVFQLLTTGKKSDYIQKTLRKLKNSYDLSIVTLNWDIVVEKHLHRKIKFHYPIKTFKFDSQYNNKPWKHNGVPIMKIHGSTNWVYCDSCRRFFTGKIANSALNKRTFLEIKDFEIFNSEEKIVKLLKRHQGDRSCPHCKNIMAGRVATFSYRKNFSIAQFQSIWEQAHAALREADLWLIVGYSMPEADFEFLHLLKSAELGRKSPKGLSIEVITKGNIETVQRYKGFFNIKRLRINKDGLEKWVE